jgi:uncharacterized protein YcaQ
LLSFGAWIACKIKSESKKHYQFITDLERIEYSGFDYIHENFLPQNKRKFGTFVHPILYGDKLIGGANLHMDRKNEKLLVNSVHTERGAPGDKEISSKIGQTLQQLAEFLGARKSHTQLASQ